MKLLSCYIAGFGKFVNQQFDLSQDLVVIKQDNGWGKTTLAAFLRCMLFGMEASRGKAIEANDRVRYEPWQGGAYGGSLAFSVGGRHYRIERSFGKTPAQDVVRVYDKNNMQCFDFGDRAERLGETVLGVNAESYMRSAYVPQGEIETGGLPDDMKTRLLALLSTGGKGETSAERAIEALDKADRALRSRRSPHNGKLDLIDARLQELAAQKAECERDMQAAQNMRGALVQKQRETEECVREIDRLSGELERLTQRNAHEAVQKSAQELQRRLLEAQTEIKKLDEFFGANDPATLNVEGLQAAVTKLYEQKKRLAEVENRLASIQGKAQELSELKTRAGACEKVLDSYDAILEKKYGKKGAGKWRAKRGKRIKTPINKTVISVLAASILVAIAGAVLIEVIPYVAYSMLGVGLIAMIISFLLILPRREKLPQEVRAADDMQDEISLRYDETYAELRELEKQIEEYPEGLEEEYVALTQEYAELQQSIAAQEKAVYAFLQNFRFAEIYDHRASLNELREKIVAHAKWKAEISQTEEKLREYPPEALRNAQASEQAHNTAQTGDVSAIKAQKTAWEQRKDELTKDYASTLSRIEHIETKADKTPLLSEESRLSEEKARLEKRHRAILSAKQFLERARANMAARYLDPVERGCKQYLQFLGGHSTLRFAADGAPFCEENGQFRALAYYSAGSKELVGLCTRIALVDAVYTKERPTLILDDPFVNFDDEKTEKAKRLVKELSKKYQIIYLTCKNERKI